MPKIKRVNSNIATLFLSPTHCSPSQICSEENMQRCFRVCRGKETILPSWCHEWNHLYSWRSVTGFHLIVWNQEQPSLVRSGLLPEEYLEISHSLISTPHCILQTSPDLLYNILRRPERLLWVGGHSEKAGSRCLSDHTRFVNIQRVLNGQNFVAYECQQKRNSANHNGELQLHKDSLLILLITRHGTGMQQGI